MQSSTIIVLACLIFAVAARSPYDAYPVEALEVPSEAVYESIYGAPAQESSIRNKRSLLLLKKKLLLGALGLKAAKVGAVGAGVAALALKKKSVPHVHKTHVVTDHGYHGYSSHTPSGNVEVHSWSG